MDNEFCTISIPAYDRTKLQIPKLEARELHKSPTNQSTYTAHTNGQKGTNTIK